MRSLTAAPSLRGSPVPAGLPSFVLWITSLKGSKMREH